MKRPDEEQRVRGKDISDGGIAIMTKGMPVGPFEAKEPVESITLLHVVKIEEPEMVGKVLEMTKMFEQEGNDDESRDIFKDLMRIMSLKEMLNRSLKVAA